MTSQSGGRGGSSPEAQVVELDSALWRHLLDARDDGAFLESWLALQARQLPGVEGAILAVLDADGRLRPAAHWPKDAPPGMAALRVAQAAVERRLGVVRRAPASGGDDGGREICAFAYPVILDDNEVAAVAAFTLATPTAEETERALRAVQWGAVWLENHFRRLRGRALAESAERLATALDLVAVGLDHSGFASAALALATEACTRLGCERVSIGFAARPACRVAAISHNADFSRRQNLVRAIGEAMDEAMDQGTTVLWPAPPEEHVVTVKHRELSQRLGAGGPVVTVPFERDGRPVGAVTFEYPAGHALADGDLDVIGAFAALAVAILDLRRREDRSLVAKATESAGRQITRLVGPGYPGRKLALAAALGVVAPFAFWRAEFLVPARASLEGEVQRVVTAPFDGYIADERARPGDIVRAGDELARLDDRELQLELATWKSRRAQFEAERRRALAERDPAAAAVFEAQIAEAEVQIDLVERRIEQARLIAPFDGVVISGDLSQARGSGVRLGDPLFQIAPLSAYRVVLRVDEQDITEIDVGARGALLLAARPDRELGLTLTRITAVTIPEEGHTYFRAEARLDAAPDWLRPGMEGVAKIDAGERLVIWAWTRRLLAWLRLTIWKWLP